MRKIWNGKGLSSEEVEKLEVARETCRFRRLCNMESGFMLKRGYGKNEARERGRGNKHSEFQGK